MRCEDTEENRLNLKVCYAGREFDLPILKYNITYVLSMWEGEITFFLNFLSVSLS